MKYRVVKTYGNEKGLSCAFRQWKADSHCSLIHGYSLGFEITFEAEELDERNWVIDFGDLGRLKNFLKEYFDHKTVVAENDPYREEFEYLADEGVCELVILPETGCEMFAQHVFEFCEEEYNDMRVQVVSVRCFEHGANSALFGNF